MNRYKGFTLIELLVVLNIVLLGSYFIIPKKSLIICNEQFVFSQIQLCIEKARLLAIENKDYYTIIFNENYLSINDSITYQNPIVLFDSNKVTYNSSGHIVSPTTVYFKIQDKVFKIIFNLGHGSYHIEKV